MPLSVSGWRTICWKTLNGNVATWEPASAASVTWRGWRIECRQDLAVDVVHLDDGGELTG